MANTLWKSWRCFPKGPIYRPIHILRWQSLISALSSVVANLIKLSKRNNTINSLWTGSLVRKERKKKRKNGRGRTKRRGGGGEGRRGEREGGEESLRSARSARWLTFALFSHCGACSQTTRLIERGYTVRFGKCTKYIPFRKNAKLNPQRFVCLKDYMTSYSNLYCCYIKIVWVRGDMRWVEEEEEELEACGKGKGKESNIAHD